MAGRPGPVGVGLAGPALRASLVDGPASGAPGTDTAPPPRGREGLAGRRAGRAAGGGPGRARTPATQEALERDEEMLVGEAGRLPFESFVRLLAYWSHHADPDGTEDDAASGRAAPRFHLSQSFENMWWGDLVLAPISGAILAKALSRIEEELFDADWAEARARLGDAVTTSDTSNVGPRRDGVG